VRWCCNEKHGRNQPCSSTFVPTERASRRPADLLFADKTTIPPSPTGGGCGEKLDAMREYEPWCDSKSNLIRESTWSHPLAEAGGSILLHGPSVMQARLKSNQMQLSSVLSPHSLLHQLSRFSRTKWTPTTIDARQLSNQMHPITVACK
jgi:hypothetical protein